MVEFCASVSEENGVRSSRRKARMNHRRMAEMMVGRGGGR